MTAWLPDAGASGSYIVDSQYLCPVCPAEIVVGFWLAGGSSNPPSLHIGGDHESDSQRMIRMGLAASIAACRLTVPIG